MRPEEWWGFFGFPCCATSEPCLFPLLVLTCMLYPEAAVCPMQCSWPCSLVKGLEFVSALPAVTGEHRMFSPDVVVAEGELGLCPGFSMCWQSCLLGSFQRKKEKCSLLELWCQACCSCFCSQDDQQMTFHICCWELQPKPLWKFWSRQSWNSWNLKY